MSQGKGWEMSKLYITLSSSKEKIKLSKNIYFTHNPKMASSGDKLTLMVSKLMTGSWNKV